LNQRPSGLTAFRFVEDLCFLSAMPVEKHCNFSSVYSYFLLFSKCFLQQNHHEVKDKFSVLFSIIGMLEKVTADSQSHQLLVVQ